MKPEKTWSAIRKGAGKTDAEARALADDEYDKTLYIPPIARWDTIKDLKHDISADLNKAIHRSLAELTYRHDR